MVISQHKLIKFSPSGFTVLELLIGLALIIVALVILLYYFDPDEFLKSKRDEKRMADLKDLKEALDRYVDSGTGTVSLGPANVVFGSNPGVVKDKDNQIVEVRFNTKNALLTNSLGWLPVNFDLVQDKNFSNDLPRDPRNIDNFIYTYSTDVDGKFKLTAAFESKKYQPQMSQDCGENPDRYELGTNCTLQP